MIRINKAADLEDLFGGQTDFEWSVTLTDGDGEILDIIGAGHTCAEAVAEARGTFQMWRAIEESRELARLTALTSFGLS